MAGVNVQPLVHDDMLTQFPPTAPISAIIDSMMIERWNISSSFDQYYNTCQPSYCTYMYTLRDPSILSVTTSLISLVGGLSATLRFIVPLIINLFLRSRDRKKKSLQSSNFCSYSEALTNRLSLFFPHSSCAMVSSTARFRKTFSESRSYKTICFEHLSSSPLSHGLKRNTLTTLGQWSTRLHFFLLIFTFVILAFQVAIRPELLTKTYAKPTFDLYSELADEHRR